MDPWSCHPAFGFDAKKKSLIASERDPWQRALFCVQQAGWDADEVVVLDEFGSNTDLTRRYARASKGERVCEAVPRNTPRNTTTIAALTTQGMGPALVLNGSLTRAAFEVYIAQILGPTLRAGQVVVLDNATAHHGGRIAELLAARGCSVCYLPRERQKERQPQIVRNMARVVVTAYMGVTSPLWGLQLGRIPKRIEIV